MNYLAHSAKPKRGIPAQTYADHVENVVKEATLNAHRAAEHSAKLGELLRAAVRSAAEFHDLGKLDDVNQDVLRTNHGKMLNHVDAGVAHLWRGATGGEQLLAAIAVFAHHAGLPDWSFEWTRGTGMILRDAEVMERTDKRLHEYRRRHSKSVVNLPPIAVTPNKLEFAPTLWRIALSCLVDADHSDTARHYGDPVVARCAPQLYPSQRLNRLDEYVATLGRSRTDERSRMRAQVYQQCRAADCTPGIVTCDSPVGSGKTTAVMAHLLRAAEAKALRRVLVVLPFTNIIEQSVEVYRKALVASDEASEEVVAAHHHKSEFDDPAARQYSFLWHAPVVVTTAVQFFETLAARHPSSLRKLHQLPGSAIFIDEAHTALPSQLWPLAWQWLAELERDWHCHIVLGSGSLHEFWTLRDFVDPPTSLPSIVSRSVREASSRHERLRVTYRRWQEPLDLQGLAECVERLEGPRLLIVNTVQSAAAVARHLARQFGSEHVEHLSTALTPRDRKATLDRVKLRLRQPNHRDWTLVTTSCLEAGVDVSFRTGIRERCSLTSLLQTSGRVNRSNEYGQADIWDIQLRHDHLLRPHPAFEVSSRILGKLFEEDLVCTEICTEALRREITEGGMPKRKEDLLKAERNADFPKVEELFRIISSNTLTAVVDLELIHRLESGDKVTRTELQTGSVQIWQERENEWGCECIAFIPDLKKWTLPYDSFLGYMAGVLPLIDGGHEGFIV